MFVSLLIKTLPLNTASSPTNKRLLKETSSSTFKFPLIDASDAMLLMENADPPTIKESGVINNLPPKETSLYTVKSVLTVTESPTINRELKEASPYK